MPASGAAVGRLGGASPRHGAQNGPCSEGGHLPPSKLGCARSGRARVYRGLHDGRVDPATGLNQRRSSSRSAPNSLRPTQRQCAISAYAAAEKPVAAPPPAVCAPRRARPGPHDKARAGKLTRDTPGINNRYSWYQLLVSSTHKTLIHNTTCGKFNLIHCDHSTPEKARTVYTSLHLQLSVK